MKRILLAALFLFPVVWAQLPAGEGVFRFAVIGDTGTGGRAQFDIGSRLAEFQQKLGFQLVLMLGDNLYGSQKPRDYRQKFELPYAGLLKSGVNFYAVLGNHDQPSQESYAPFHMEGKRYYAFSPRPGVHFFALDSNRLDQEQLTWLDHELERAGDGWKIAFLHHPLYSSGGRHGSDMAIRAALEPLLVKHGVSVVLAGHDHFYERSKPQQSVTHFVVGGSAKLRAGDARRTGITAAAFDRDNSFLLMEIHGDSLRFQAVSRSGETVDSGSITRPHHTD